MSLEVIYVTRHGFRPAFAVDPATGTYTAAIHSPTRIPTDPPLTSYGVDQANELAVRLLEAQPPIDHVYSSPYYRCLQTINPYVAAAAATVRVEHGLSEWHGLAPWEHPAPAPLSRLRELFPGRVDAGYEASGVAPSRHGESLSQLHDRAAAAMDALVARADREGARAVVLCTHAAVVIALGRVLTGRMPERVDEEDFAAYTCGLSVYRRRRRGRGGEPAVSSSTGGAENALPAAEEPGMASDAARPEVPQWKGGRGVRGGWTCEADSDTSFLSGGPERGWRFSGDESFSTVEGGSLAGSGAGLGVDVEVQGSSGQRRDVRPMVDGSKL